MTVSPRTPQGRFSADFSLNEKLQSIGAALGLVESNRCVVTAELFSETTAVLPAGSVVCL
jgi:hypothetical protein